MTINTRAPLGDQLREGREEVSEIRSEIASIIDDVLMLARKEAELAGAEIGEQMMHSRQAATFGGAAVVMALLTAVFGGLALMFGLDTVMPLWAAALITCAVLGVVAVIAALMAREHARQVSVVPKRTIESVNEDVRWARQQLTLNAR